MSARVRAPRRWRRVSVRGFGSLSEREISVLGLVCSAGAAGLGKGAWWMARALSIETESGARAAVSGLRRLGLVSVEPGGGGGASTVRATDDGLIALSVIGQGGVR